MRTVSADGTGAASDTRLVRPGGFRGAEAAAAEVPLRVVDCLGTRFGQLAQTREISVWRLQRPGVARRQTEMSRSGFECQ